MEVDKMPYTQKGENRNTGRTHFKKGNIPWSKILKGNFPEKILKNMSMAQKGRKKPPWTEEHRRKIGESTKRNMLKLWQNPEYRKHMSEVHKGFKVSDKTKQKLSLIKKGHFISEETRRKIGLAFRGRKASLEARNNMSIAHKGLQMGSKHPNWKGGITPLFTQIRNCKEDDEWKKKVFKRDNYICQNCRNNESRNLEIHHIKRFSIILQEFLKEYSQFSPIEDKETLFRLAIYYKPFFRKRIDRFI